MKLNKTIGLPVLLLGMTFTANAQNVWTGTTTPTTTTGQVGIGLSSPGAQLDIANPAGAYPVGLRVKRNASISAFSNIVEIWNYTSSLDFWIDGGGYVGIRSLATPGPDKMVTVGSSGLLETQNIPAPQTLSISGSTLSISGGNSVAIPTGSGDNLGNHMATSNLNMNAKSIIGVSQLKFQNSSQFIQGYATNNALAFSGAVGIGGLIPLSSSTALEVNGNVIVNGTVTSSDKRFKKNISPMDDLSSRLYSLMPYQYNFKEGYKNRNFDDNLHFGLIAQEVKEVFPNLVSVIDAEGHMGINYVEFIPLLLQALKEQEQKINALEANSAEQDKRIAALEAALQPVSVNSGTPLNTAIEALKGSTLYQNTPNPFNRETTIRYHITGQFENAFIGIYDLNGKQVKRITVKEANSQIVVPANLLSPGTYIYSLVVEGQLIDSKKMVVID